MSRPVLCHSRPAGVPPQPRQGAQAQTSGDAVRSDFGAEAFESAVFEFAPHRGETRFAAQRMQLATQVEERPGDHHLSGAWAASRYLDLRLDVPGARRHNIDTVGQEDRLNGGGQVWRRERL